MTEEFNPLVSIVIPVYNGSNYLREAIDSALAQTYRNVEILVINDGSNDGGKTRDIALSYGDRIRYFEKENGGVATALNLGIREMQGEYFSWLSHDDVYYPDKVETQVQYLDTINEKKKMILVSDWINIDENSAEIKRFYADKKPGLEQLLHIQIHPCTALIPVECFDEVGLFDEKNKTTQDYEFLFQVNRQYKFIHIKKPFVKVRLHSSQGSNVVKNHISMINFLLIGFLDRITEKEVDDNCRNIGVFYIKLALFYDKCEYYAASDYAYKLATERSDFRIGYYFFKALLIIRKSFYYNFMRKVKNRMVKYKKKVFNLLFHNHVIENKRI